MKPCFKSCLYLPSKVLLAWVALICALPDALYSQPIPQLPLYIQGAPILPVLFTDYSFLEERTYVLFASIFSVSSKELKWSRQSGLIL